MIQYFPKCFWHCIKMWDLYIDTIVFVQLGYVHRYIVIYYQHVGMYNITMECTCMDLYTYIECTI